MLGDTFGRRKYRVHADGYTLLDHLSGQDEGSKGAFWCSVWSVRVYRSRISRPRRRTDSARRRVGFGVEAGGTDRPPTVQHDRAPGVLGLDLETDHIASPALIANGRDHPPGLKRQRRTPQTHPAACLNAEASRERPSARDRHGRGQQAGRAANVIAYDGSMTGRRSAALGRPLRRGS